MALNAADTFKEFIFPSIGIVAKKSQDSLINFRMPVPSLPKTITTLPL